jgi:hypothetical protein
MESAMRRFIGDVIFWAIAVVVVGLFLGVFL